MCYMTVEAELFGGTKAKENRFGGGIGGDIFNIMHTLKKKHLHLIGNFDL